MSRKEINDVATNASRVDELTESLQRECWDAALHAFGTASIFDRRALVLKRYLRRLSYVGLVVPVVVGSSVMAFNQFDALPLMIIVGGLIGVGQMAVSAWSLTAGWVDKHAYAVSSNVDNKRLSEDYRTLASRPPSSGKTFRERVELLNVANRARKDNDEQQEITSDEKRFGMRSALRNFQRPCGGCHIVPIGMKPSDCDVCGNYQLTEVRGS